MANAIPYDKIKDYLTQVEQEDNRKKRIQSLTESLLGKTKLKLKYQLLIFRLQTKETRQEEMFNKKLESMKKLSTFVDARETLNQMNLLNNPNVILKLNLLKYQQLIEQKDKEFVQQTKIDQENEDGNEHISHNLNSEYQLNLVQNIPQSPLKKKRFNLPIRNVSQPTVNDEEIEFDDLFLANKQSNSKYDTNVFYNGVFQTKSSPRKQQQVKCEENTRIKKFLQTQGLLPESGRSQKNKIIYQQFYQNFQQDSNMLIKEVKLEAKKRFSQIVYSDKKFNRFSTDGSKMLQKKNSQKFVKNHTNFDTQLITQQTTISPAKTLGQISQIQSSFKSPLKSQRSRQIFNWQIDHNYQSPSKTRVLSQIEQFTDTINSTENNFRGINKSNNRVLRRMSTAMTSVHKKYSNDFIID